MTITVPENGTAQGIFDRLNYVAQGYTLAVGPGFVRSYTSGVAMLAGTAVASTPAGVTLSASKDTYRDLNPDGTITYSAVANGAAAPALTSGALRIARTVTDSAGIVSDDILCSSSFSWGPELTIP